MSLQKIVDAQDDKGFEKYGESIDDADNQDYNWEIMALEKAADLQKYLVRRILELTGELVKKKRTRINEFLPAYHIFGIYQYSSQFYDTF